jgi:sulfur carrier protein
MVRPARDNGRAMRVLLRNPRRELDLPGPVTVSALIARLELNRESVLVILGDTLVPGDAVLADDDVVEIRPVISGGAA